jgi:hypothetical protein
MDEYKGGNRRTGGERREDYFPTYVTGELRRINECLSQTKRNVSEVRQQLNDFKICQVKDITALQVKSGVWGVIGGAVVALLAWLIRV